MVTHVICNLMKQLIIFITTLHESHRLRLLHRSDSPHYELQHGTGFLPQQRGSVTEQQRGSFLLLSGHAGL